MFLSSASSTRLASRKPDPSAELVYRFTTASSWDAPLAWLDQALPHTPIRHSGFVHGDLESEIQSTSPIRRRADLPHDISRDITAQPQPFMAKSKIPPGPFRPVNTLASTPNRRPIVATGYGRKSQKDRQRIDFGKLEGEQGNNIRSPGGEDMRDYPASTPGPNKRRKLSHAAEVPNEIRQDPIEASDVVCAHDSDAVTVIKRRLSPGPRASISSLRSAPRDGIAAQPIHLDVIEDDEPDQPASLPNRESQQPRMISDTAVGSWFFNGEHNPGVSPKPIGGTSSPTDHHSVIDMGWKDLAASSKHKESAKPVSKSKAQTDRIDDCSVHSVVSASQRSVSSLPTRNKQSQSPSEAHIVSPHFPPSRSSVRTLVKSDNCPTRRIKDSMQPKSKQLLAGKHSWRTSGSSDELSGPKTQPPQLPGAKPNTQRRQLAMPQKPAISRSPAELQDHISDSEAEIQSENRKEQSEELNQPAIVGDPESLVGNEGETERGILDGEGRESPGQQLRHENAMSRQAKNLSELFITSSLHLTPDLDNRGTPAASTQDRLTDRRDDGRQRRKRPESATSQAIDTASDSIPTVAPDRKASRSEPSADIWALDAGCVRQVDKGMTKIRQELTTSPKVKPRRTARKKTKTTPDSPGEDDVQITAPSKRWLDDNKLKPWAKDMVYPPDGRNPAVVSFQDLDRLDEDQMLNDNLVNFMLRWDESQHPGLAKDVYIFNTFFMQSLMHKNGKSAFNYESVASWTRKIDLFSYQFVVVPLNKDYHWSIFIVCNPGKLIKATIKEGSRGSEELGTTLATNIADLDVDKMTISAESPAPDTSIFESIRNTFKVPDNSDMEDHIKEKRLKKSGARGTCDPDLPHIIVLDSLGKSHSPELSTLRRYLSRECEDKKGEEASFGPKDIPAINAKGIPLQTNHTDCGVFAIEYVHSFLKKPKGFDERVCNKEIEETNHFGNFSPTRKRDFIRTTLIKLQTKLQPEQEDEPAKKIKTRGETVQTKQAFPEAPTKDVTVEMLEDRQQSGADRPSVEKLNASTPAPIASDPTGGAVLKAKEPRIKERIVAFSSPVRKKTQAKTRGTRSSPPHPTEAEAESSLRPTVSMEDENPPPPMLSFLEGVVEYAQA